MNTHQQVDSTKGTIMNTAVATTTQSRLPMPAGLNDLDSGMWQVLVESVFPSAKTAEAVVMALNYCKARKLDVFKRPVNIVPMWNKTLKKMVETVWPGINEVQVTASRTGKYAGMDEPKWGPDKTQTFEGNVKGYDDEGVWQDNKPVKIEMTYPEWCSVAVYRMVEGQRCAFTEPVFWLEAYARQGKTEVPNGMWQKRSRGQLLKVAKAFSLRAAFPEEGEYVAEEMEGKEIDAGGVVIENTHTPASRAHFKNASLRNSFVSTVIRDFEGSATFEELEEWASTHEPALAAMKASGNEHDALGLQEIQNRFGRMKKQFKAKEETAASFGQDFANTPTGEIDPTFDEAEIPPHILSAQNAYAESVGAPISKIPFARK